MKTLDATGMIDLLPCPDELRDTACSLFDSVAPVMFRNDGFLRNACLEDWTTPEQVMLDGKPAAVIFWHASPDSGLWIDATQALTVIPNVKFLFLACEMIKQRQHLRYIRFTTIRAGLVKVAQQMGYCVEAVMLSKLD